ncbi:hypothetical protein [Eubacterium sp.]|uniref:hypothetical protein n=1 Tax=Eubacterium sp. TaxID=142586 RepID=UPI0039950F69
MLKFCAKTTLWSWLATALGRLLLSKEKKSYLYPVSKSDSPSPYLYPYSDA